MTVSRARAERGLRDWRRGSGASVTKAWGEHAAFTCSTPQRQGDEMACRCGKRWPIGEDHP